ncbi:PIF1 DNA helicase/replication A1-like protein [Artemisia annua]|uniref:PIF1 DNA helicase/replication A1-like protein n=1 Tax=Artemisia annua TaxID=35608 RepID=A0A2U1L6S0_ARTAN|nr:PIF1 DNA helicase/replication A1-like protein [Artemisia annua]
MGSHIGRYSISKAKTVYVSGVGTDRRAGADYCLVELQKLELLHGNANSLSNFLDLPQPYPSPLTNLENRMIIEELNYNMKQLKIEHETLYVSLNREQQHTPGRADKYRHGSMIKSGNLK